MIVQSLIATNANGDSITFGRHFRLLEGFDLSNLTAEVNYSENTRDGASYQNTLLSTREFDLAFFIYNDFRDRSWIEERRREVFRVFNPKHNPIRLDFETKGGDSYYLNANLEGAPSLPQGFENDNLVWQKGMLQFSCNDPYIYSSSSTMVDIATWVPALQFPLVIPDEGVAFGYRTPSLIANVHNDGDSDTGMIIRFKALANASNPQLINVNTYEEFELNVNMLPGDIIEVSTYTGKKTVTLIRNNVRSNIFNTVDLKSTFLQLEPGDNLFRYNAGSGVDNLEVSMNFTNRFIGV